MVLQLVLGSVLLLVTSAVHCVLTVLLVRRTRALRVDQPLMQTPLRRSSLAVAIVLLLFLALLVEGTLWAGAYLYVGAIEDFDEALYFSLVTFTTLGYGDVVLDAEWRLLASLQAVLGIIVFGWTTGLVVAVLQRMVHLLYGDSPTDS